LLNVEDRRGWLPTPKRSAACRWIHWRPFRRHWVLSAAQVEAARALLTKQGTDSQPVLEEIRTKQDALRTLQRSGTASATDLGAALAAVQAAQAKLEAIP
jgi:hypothetical protein